MCARFVGTTLKLCHVQFSVLVCGRGCTKRPSSSFSRALKENSVRLTVLLVAWHCGALPPPGSCPKMTILPSFEKEAECPIETPVIGREYSCVGCSMPPGAFAASDGSKFSTEKPLPPAQATRFASP